MIRDNTLIYIQCKRGVDWSRIIKYQEIFKEVGMKMRDVNEHQGRV